MRFHPPSHTRYAESDQEIEMLSGKIKSCVAELRRIAEELDLEVVTSGHLRVVEGALDNFVQDASGEIERVEEEREKNEMVKSGR